MLITPTNILLTVASIASIVYADVLCEWTTPHELSERATDVVPLLAASDSNAIIAFDPFVFKVSFGGQTKVIARRLSQILSVAAGEQRLFVSTATNVWEFSDDGLHPGPASPKDRLVAICKNEAGEDVYISASRGAKLLRQNEPREIKVTNIYPGVRKAFFAGYTTDGKVLYEMPAIGREPTEYSPREEVIYKGTFKEIKVQHAGKAVDNGRRVVVIDSSVPGISYSMSHTLKFTTLNTGLYRRTFVDAALSEENDLYLLDSNWNIFVTHYDDRPLDLLQVRLPIGLLPGKSAIALIRDRLVLVSQRNGRITITSGRCSPDAFRPTASGTGKAGASLAASGTDKAGTSPTASGTGSAWATPTASNPYGGLIQALNSMHDKMGEP